MKQMIWAATLVLLPASALGADDAGNFRVKGIGLETCESIVTARSEQAPVYFLARSWLNGYLTAYNQISAATYDIAGDHDLEVLTTAIDTICSENPDQEFIIAATALTTALQPDRLVTTSATSQAPATDRDTLQRAQQALKDRGFYAGGVDGLAGPRTQAAIQSFQQDAGLAVTGELDPATLAALLP